MAKEDSKKEEKNDEIKEEKPEEKEKTQAENEAEEKETPEEESEPETENIIEEEKAEEAGVAGKDYNSIFDDDYVEPEKEEKAEKEESKEPEVADDKEDIQKESDPKEEPVDQKEDDSKEKTEKLKKAAPVTKTKKSRKFPTKKVMIILVIILALLVGAFAGFLFFKKSNKPKEETQPTTTTQPTETKSQKTVYVTADNGLNMREQPDKNAKVLAVIPFGTKLDVLEEQDGWYKVEYNGKTGWVAKDFVSETKPEDLKTYTGTGFSADNPKFSVKYPADWILDGYKISKTDNGKTYKIALGEGGHGFAEGDNTITSSQENIKVNGFDGTKTTVTKDGKIIFIGTTFLKGNGYINIEMVPPEGYDQSYIDIYNKIVETFKFL